MLRYAVPLVISLVMTCAWAQQAPPQAAAPPDAAASVQPAKALVPMEEPQPGDRWTYEVRDEITGSVTATRENVVTEVTPTEISVRFRIGETTGRAFQPTFDNIFFQTTPPPDKAIRAA